MSEHEAVVQWEQWQMRYSVMLIGMSDHATLSLHREADPDTGAPAKFYRVMTMAPTDLRLIDLMTQMQRELATAGVAVAA